MKLEEKLVALRKEKGLSQLKLEEMMDVSRQAISRWEVGSATPSIENLTYLGRLYDVPLEYLLHDDAPEPSKETPSVEETARKQKKRNHMLAAIVIGIFAVALCAILFFSKGEKPISMNNIEGSEMETVNDFELDW